VVRQNGGVRHGRAHIAEPTLQTLHWPCMHAGARTGVDTKLSDLGPCVSTITSSLRTAHTDKSEHNYKLSMYISRQHCAAIKRLHRVHECQSSLSICSASISGTFWIFGRAFLASRRAGVLDLTIIHGRNVCALYTTLQFIVSILPRRASWFPGLATWSSRK